MDVPWSQLKEEATALAADIGRSGREHHSIATSASLQAAIRAHGVPAEHREWVWPILLHAQSQKMRRRGSTSAGYTQLLDGLDEELKETSAEQPSSSLERAQEMAMERFEHMNPFQERKINRILVAYSKSKETFFYCHGMIEVCVVLSTFMVEEDAFWSFRLLLEVLLPKYYDESVVDFHRDCLVLQELLQTLDPALQEHLSMMGVTIQLLSTKWFFSFFAESMPFEVVGRLYDILLADICGLRLNSKILLSTSLAVLLYLGSAIVEIHDPSVILEVINEFCWTTLSDYSIADSFIDLILFIHERIDDDELAGQRQRYREQLAREEEQRRNQQLNILRRRSGSFRKKQRQQLHQRKNRMQSIKLLIQWRKHVSNELDSYLDQGGANKCDAVVEDQSSSPPKSSTGEQFAKLAAYDDALTPDGEQQDRTRDYDDDDEGDSESQDEMEVVTTPSDKEMMAKVYQGINKINRRRSRSSARQTQAFRANDRSLSRTFSLTSSFLSSTPRELREHEPLDTDDGANTSRENEADVWKRLKVSGEADEVVAQSMSGIPDEHRTWAWPILISQLPRPSNLPPLPSSIANDNEDTDMLLDREVAKSIDNDILRTRNLGDGQAVLMRRVLTAFALRNRRVGYCQGMNEILVVLLQYLDADQALVALVLLIETLLPAYHVDSMIGLHTDCAVMDTLLRQNDKDLHSHLNEVGLNMEILCTKWLVTCFLTSLPPFCGLKIIDMLLARAKEKQRASRVLLGVGISIFFSLRATLLDAKDAGEVLLAINEYFAEEMTKTTVQMDRFLGFCRDIIHQLEPDIVEELRQVHKDEVMDRFAAFEAKKIEMRQQLEEAKLKQRKSASAPSSPVKLDGNNRTSIFSSNSSGTKAGASNSRRSGISSYLGNQLRGAPKAAAAFSSSTANDEKGSKFYQRVDVLDVNRSFSDDLLKMEDQLDDLADLYLRGKIDEREHSCIRAQIVRKWCKGMNSPQSAMMRMRSVKNIYGTGSGSSDPGRASCNGASGRGSVQDNLPRRSLSNAEPMSAHAKKGGSSLYGRMKKVQRSAMAMIKSTFE